jgi:Uma2 family endonuclease
MAAVALTGLNLPFGRELTVEDVDRIPWAGAKFELYDGVLVVSDGNFTVEDLDEVPDDGHRYELLDGVLVVTPAPNVLHQHISGRLHALLARSARPPFDVFAAPTDVLLPDLTRMQPDLVVARDVDLSGQTLGVPVLAVEILAPRTRGFDLGVKKELLAAAGCPSYWVVDPEQPSIRAWELRDGEYVEVGRAVGDQVVELTRPFFVAVRPADLVRR